jgi:hypothetical protein
LITTRRIADSLIESEVFPKHVPDSIKAILMKGKIMFRPRVGSHIASELSSSMTE